MTKTFSVREFEAFCRGKVGEKYSPLASSVCALAQFGFPGLNAFNCKNAGIPAKIYEAAVHDAVGPDRNTFSALADRLAKIEEQL